jgi:hypothetical protein
MSKKKLIPMKKIMTILGALLVGSMLMTSCISTNRGFQSSPVISRNVQLDPIKADIKVDEKSKIKGESSSAYFLIFKVSGDNTYADGINYSTDASASMLSQLNPIKLAQAVRLNKVRGAAAYKALSTGDYDVLVHPNYTTTVKNYLIFKKYIVKVEGYGAKYENFRTEKQKIVILQDGKELILQDK